MTRTRIWTKRVLANIVAFLMIYGVIAMALFIVTKDMSQVLLLLVLFLPFFALFAARFFVDNIFAFLLLHIFIAVLPVVVFSGIIQIFAVVFLAFSAILSVRQKLKGEWELGASTVFFILAMVCALTILGQLNGINELTNLYIVMSFVIMVCCLLNYQIDNIDKSLVFSAKESLQPINSILRFNNRIIAFFIMIVVGGGLLSFVLPFGRVMSFAANVLLSVLRLLFGLFSGEESVPEPESPPLEEAPMNDDPMMPIADAGSGFFYTLGMIFYYLVTVVAIVGIVAAIVYAVLRFYKAYYGTKKTDGDIKEFITPEIEMGGISRVIDKIKRRFDTSPQQKLRRLYYKKVSGYIAGGVKIKTSHTTQDIAEILNSQEDIDDLTRQYEKVRYGSE